MNEGEFAPDSERNIESLLLSLQSNQNSESNSFTATNRFRYCHDVITLSKIPEFISNIISFVILVAYDFSICFQAIPFHWFESLSPNKFLEDPSSLNFIFSELVVQQISFAVILFILIFVVFQWISLLFYDPNLHMSPIKSSFLYFSFNYLPFILSPVIGTLFGSLVLATSGDSTQNTSIFYALFLPSMYLLLMLNFSIFNSTCEYNLIIGNSYFSYFYPPFNIVDAMVMFFLAFCTAFCYDSQKAIMTICASVSMAWGILFFFIKRQHSFVSVFPNVFYHKLPVDAIIFSFLTVIKEWVSIPSQFLFDLWITLFLFDFGAAVLNVRFYFLTAKIRFEHVGIHKFNPAKISKSIQALNTLRIGITFRFTEALDKEFLSWCLLHYCSEALIVDTVRICLSLDIPLSEMPLPRFSLTPRHLTSMKFIAFQLDQFRKYQSDDSSQLVEIALAELERESENLKNFTESDSEHHSITWLGKAARRSKKLFFNYAAEYANSKKIARAWNDFCSNVLCAPSKAVSPPPNAFELLPLPFSYALNDKKTQIKRIKPQKSSIERLTQQFANSAISPYRLWVRLSLIVFLCFVIGDNINYTSCLRHFATIFSDISQLFIYGAALSYQFLKNIDSFSPLPTVEEICSVIGIPESIANDFKSNFELTSEEINNGISYLSLFKKLIPKFSKNNCAQMSLLLTTDFEQPPTATIEQHRCYTSMMQYYIDTVANHTNDRVHEVIEDFKVHVIDDFSWLAAVYIVLTIFYIIIFIMIKKKQIKALSIIKKINLKKYEYREPAFSFSIIVSIFLWIIILGVAFALFYVFSDMVQSNSILMRDCLTQMDIISDIARNAMTGLALSEFSLLDKENYLKYEKYVFYRGEFVINSTQLLTVDGINQSFMNVKPLSHWSTPDSNSFSVLLLDFGHMMINGNFTVNGYNFLMMRYLLIYNISQLANSTLENMMAAALFELQGEGSSFWLSSIGFLLFALIAWVLLEFLHYKHRLWFNGVRFIFRRELSASPKRMRNILELIDKEHESILEKLTFPAIILKDRKIIDCNEDAAKYMKLSIEQIKGQFFDEFFDNDVEVQTDSDQTIQFSKFPFSDSIEMIRIDDRSKFLKKEESKRQFVQKMRPKVDKLPIHIPSVYYIAFKIVLNNIEAFDKVETTFSSIESKFEDSVIRITIGLTFYKAVVLENSPEIAVRFVGAVLEQFGNCVCAALTKDSAVIVPVVENDVVSVACGEAVERGEQYLLCCKFGQCIIDESIVNELHLESQLFITAHS